MTALFVAGLSFFVLIQGPIVDAFGAVIGERRFAGWSMGQVNMSRLNPALLLKYSERPTLDPYSVSGRVSLALLEDLMATAAICGRV